MARTILVVDDDEAHAESSADCLRTVGYECDVATSGQEGAYQITLTWAAINQTDPIDFEGETTREFEAEFSDTRRDPAALVIIQVILA